MTREEKAQVIQELTTQLAENATIYLADISGLNAQTTSDLRRAAFKANVKLNVVKNTLLAKAMEASDKDFGDLSTVLKGNTSIMIAEESNAPAKLIKNFRKKSDKPLLKGAYIEEEVYIGDEQLDALVAIKSKDSLSEMLLHYCNLLLRTLFLDLNQVVENWQVSYKLYLKENKYALKTIIF